MATKRKAQKLAGPTTFCSVSPETWSKFIKEQKIAETTIVEYYSLPRPRGADEKALKAWRLSLVTEFFHDLVATGTLDIPSDFETDSFVFKIGKDQGYDILYASHPTSYANALIHFVPEFIWDENALMENLADEVLGDVCNAVDTLTRASRPV